MLFLSETWCFGEGNPRDSMTSLSCERYRSFRNSHGHEFYVRCGNAADTLAHPSPRFFCNERECVAHRCGDSGLAAVVASRVVDAGDVWEGLEFVE